MDRITGCMCQFVDCLPIFKYVLRITTLGEYMPEVDVSVVVPIYNGAKYLRECISFLKAQTYSNFEIILIVDATSDDGTVEIANELGSNDPQIRVIIQEEGCKLSGNRNIGLAEAKGDAVWFVDVDDAPSPDFIRDMYGLLCGHDVDFVCCDFINTDTKGVVKERKGAKYHFKVMNRQEAKESRANDEFPVSAWSKLFRRSFLVDNNLIFEESFAEDIAHTYRCLDKCSKICIYNRPLYAYRQTPNSICRAKGHEDKRGEAEIESYNVADKLCVGDPVALRRNAVMKMRSSGHMSYRGFMKYAKSEANRESYRTYLKGNPEAWWHLHISSLYWIALRTYVVLVYKRKGSRAMTKKWW